MAGPAASTAPRVRRASPPGNQRGKAAWLLHCPWRGKSGVAFQDFTLTLPGATRITLRGETALRADAVGKSDGAVFRIFVDGAKRFEGNRADAEWQPFALDLTVTSVRPATFHRNLLERTSTG